MSSNANNVPVSSSIFYTNTLLKKNDEKLPELRNSILEDQFDAFKKRDHYLRRSAVVIDSTNRRRIETIQSTQIDFSKIGFLMNKNYNGQIFLYLPNTNLENNSFIYFTNLSKLLPNINEISTRQLEFSKIKNSPIFNLTTVSNKTALEIFGWATINSIIQSQYLTKEQMIADDKNFNFFSFFYTTNTGLVNLNNYATLFITKKPNLFLLNERVIGYPESSYFKIALSHSFNNIYKIRLLDINLPDVIFNINNDSYVINNYKYLLNGKLRFMMYDDQFLVSNIDYVGARIKYDFFQKEAIYDVNGFKRDDYKFAMKSQPQKYPHFYLANDIYQLMMNILNNINTSEDFLIYANNNIFEVAYFFLQQFHLYYNTDVFSNYDNTYYNSNYTLQRNPNLINKIYYIYTSDIVNSYSAESNFILRSDNTLNIKTPLVYFNDYLLYVNNETFNLSLKICNWMDKINLNINEGSYNEDFGYCKLYCLINNIDERVVGTIQDINRMNQNRIIRNSNKYTIKNIYYTVSLKISNSRYNSQTILGQSIYALYTNTSTNYVKNTVDSYLNYSVENNTYYYKIFLDFTSIPYNFINTNIYQYNSTVYRLITIDLINETNNIINKNFTNYILILGNCPPNFAPISIIGNIIYSKYADDDKIYIPNTVNEFVGPVTINSNSYYAYKIASNEQNAFNKFSSIYVLNNSNTIQTYLKIGTAIDIFDVFYNVQLDQSISNFLPGNSYITSNAQKKNYFLKSLGDHYYLAAYSSEALSNYNFNLLLSNEQLYLNVELWQENPIGIVSLSYLEIGIISDVQFDLILDASLYLSENTNYDIETQNVNSDQLSALQTKNINKGNIVTQYTSVILLDNIRIVETKTQTKNNIINYVNKTLLLKNSSGISFENKIISQPIYDKQINMFVFRLSLKTPGINIGTIYTTKSFIGSIDSELVGTGYSLCYMPLEYTLLIEKSDDFQIEYLQNWSKYVYTKFPDSKFVSIDTFINRNYSIFNPEKTNLTGFTNYNMVPFYEITIENGDYDNMTFVAKIETELNKTNYLQFDYLKKTLDINDTNIKKINEPNYEKPRFKVLFNETTKKIQINSYKISNRLKYKAIYNQINPYIYFKIGNANIENNKRIFIEVLRDAANNNITNELTKLLNKEFTTRILPVFEYEIRIISPVPDLQYINNIDVKERIIPDSIIDILRQISINPFQFRSNYPGLNDKMRFVGQTLKNIFNNSNSYTGNGNIVFNAGVPCAFKEDELVIVINNIYYNYEVYKMGRIVKIVDTTSNYKGNFEIMIQLSGEEEVSQPIFIGDILYGLTSQTIGCVVPYEWGILSEYPEIAQLHAGLPTEDIIRLGYKNYLKLLYNVSHREYLLEYIHKYSIENFIHFNSYNQLDNSSNSKSNTTCNSLNNWPISEVKNCYNGFEIYFEFPVSFEIIETELVLYFLKPNRYCLFAGKNTNNVYDTPKDMLGFNDDKILNVNDYIGSENDIPWNTTFDNTNNFSQQSINKMYITYGSDNILQNNMYLSVDDTSNYKKGDIVYINDLNVRTHIQRSIFNMYNSSNYNIHRMFSFDIYLTFIAIRLAFIKSGVPISMGPNDYLGIVSSGQYGYLNMWQYFMMRIPNSLFVEPNKNMLAYVNLIYENFNTNVKSNQFPGLNENISANLKNNPPLNSQNISDNYALVINTIILGKILPWFIQPDNLLLWTKGSRNDYIYILETYIEISNKNIWRFELEVIDEFIFKKNIMVKDKNGNIFGKTSFNNQYSDYSPINNASYVLYIFVVNGYDVLGNLNELNYIYADDMMAQNRLITKPINITDSNKYIYLYDTYLKFKTIIQIVPDNTDTIQKSMNFNKIDSINSLMMNLFNLDNQNINCFKNGYYVNFGKNEIYPQDTSFVSGQHRILINLLDNKNLLHMCFHELGLISEFTNIKNDIINMPVNNVKDIVQIYSLLDIFQLLIDLSPINTVMIDLDYTQLIENNIHNCFQYQIRMVDNIYSICGSRNFVLESVSYQSKFAYGTTDNPDGNVVGYLNNYFSQIYSDVEVEKYKANGTVESNMCNLTNIYNKNAYGRDINKNLVVFNEPNTFIYGALWVPGDPGDKSLYVIVPFYSPYESIGSNKSVLLFNKNNLANYLITINFIYVDQQKSINVDNIEKNEIVESNVVESIQPILTAYETFNDYKLPKYTKDSNGNITSLKMETYRIFKINLKYELKYNVIRGTLIQIRDYYTTIYKQPDIKIKNNYKLYILQNWIDDKQMVLKPGYVIRINYGSYNSIYQKYINNTNNFNEQLSSFDVDDIVHEETNLITDISSNFIEIGGKKYWELTLLNPVKYEFKSGLPIIININPQNNSSYTPSISNSSTPYDLPYEKISESISNANDILTNGLATQNIIVNGEWYTKIFYQSEKNIDLYDLNPGGVKSLNNISKKKINISGMKGYVFPNVGFQSIERNYYNSVEVNLEDVQNNNDIKPVPDGLYDLVQTQKEDNLKILNNNNDISISGFYNTIYNDNSPEQEDEWIDNFQNIRWYYAIETNNNISMTSLRNIDLFQMNIDNTSVINPNITGQPYTIFDKICRLLSVESTTYVFEGKSVYKVYVILNIKNLINNFLYDSFNFPTVYSKDIDNIPYNMYLSTYTKTHNIQIIYYGIRESVDYNYSYLYKRYNYYSITIKGRFQGYGGNISLNTNNNIFNSIPYTVADVKSKYNTIELDLNNNTDIFLSYYRFNTTGYKQRVTDIYKKNYNKSSIKTTQINPAFTGFNQVPLQQNINKNENNEIINYYDIFPSKYGFLANDGIVFKKTINQPLSTNTYDYIYLCFKNIESSVVVEQSNQIGNYTIFAKVYKDNNKNGNLEYTNYEVIYDLQLKSKLNEIEVFFLDKNGNLANFNNIDVNFQLEIYEYVERVKNINTKNGMVF